jgi:hypothetical protein
LNGETIDVKSGQLYLQTRTDTTRRKKSNGKHEGLKSYLNNLKRE